MQYRKMGKWGVKLSTIGLGSYLTIGFKLGVFCEITRLGGQKIDAISMRF